MRGFLQRRLPHLDQTQRPVFLTWRLHGSLPENRTFPVTTLSSGQAFAAMDRLLDQTRAGPLYLRQPELADMVVEAIHYNATVLGHYTLHAFVAMPNHVHLLVTPAVALCKLTKSLKGITAKRANAMLALTGNPFWQEESYDHLVRQGAEFDKIRYYIEENPVHADCRRLPTNTDGRVRDGRPGRGPGVRPTMSFHALSNTAYSNRTMSLNDGNPAFRGILLFKFLRLWKAAMGKWESCFWISTFPRGSRRGCGNVGIATAISKGCGKRGKPAFGFPRFP